MSRRDQPYRGGAPSDQKEAAREEGLVGDLIRQFADPLAFYRELVQNAIDAGSSKVVVQLLHADAVMRVAVRDDGSGMTQEIIEDHLLVLFRSSKEERDDAIGKFGVGFVSVFALEPELVVVDTATDAGPQLTLHLHPDQSWDLFRGEGTQGRGTSVTLHIPMDGAEVESFVTRSEAALRHWCQHARVTIQFVAMDQGAAAPRREARIDTPFAVSGTLVSVLAQSADAITHVSVGLTDAAQARGAFYNQGLLLATTRDEQGGAIVFKVSDARLEHTLSRDDVRRDANYARAVELVQSAVRGPLTEAVERALEEAAQAYVAGSAEAGARWVDVLYAARAAELPLDPRKILVPTAAGRLRPIAAFTERPPLGSNVDSPLAAALERSGRPLIDLRVAGDAVRAARRDAALQHLLDAPLTLDELSYTLIAPEPPSEVLGALLRRVDVLLAGVHRRPSELIGARLSGAGATRLTLSAARKGEPWLVAAQHTYENPFRLLMRPPLIVRIDHPIVVGAIERYPAAPAMAAHLLARAILVSAEALTDARAEELTTMGVLSAARGEHR